MLLLEPSEEFQATIRYEHSIVNFPRRVTVDKFSDEI